MSAPDTDVDKQARRHFGPIIGITAGLVFVVILYFAYTVYLASPEVVTPADAVQVDENAANPSRTDGNATIQADDMESLPAGEPSAPPSDGPATTRGEGADGDIGDALPNQ